MSVNGRDVAIRLRAYMAEFELGNKELAELCGAKGVSAVSNWLSLDESKDYANLPRVPNMVALCEETGLTLEWIYRGMVTSNMDPKLAARLRQRISSGEIKMPVERAPQRPVTLPLMPPAQSGRGRRTN